MKSVFYTFSGAVAVIALAAAPALGQDRGPQGGGGGVHSGGGGMGAAGGGGSNGPAGSSGMSAASGGSSSAGVSGGGGGYSGGGYSGGGGYAGGSVGDSGGGSPTSGGFSGGGSSMSGASPMGGTRRMAADRPGRPEAGGAALRSGASRNALASDPSNTSIPGGSRPNYGNPAIGTAVPRPSSGGSGGSGGGSTDGGYWGNGNSWYGDSPYWWYYGGSYYGSSYWGSPYYRLYYPYDPFFMYGYGAFGMGFLYYDPLWFGSGMYGSSSGSAASVFYGASPLSSGDTSSGGASPGGWSGAGGWSSSTGSGSSGGPKGGLKLKVEPPNAEVYVDGYFVGRVDNYNGAFQRLELPAGLHRVELRAKGYNNVSFEAKIEPRDTISYRGTMQALQPAK